MLCDIRTVTARFPSLQTYDQLFQCSRCFQFLLYDYDYRRYRYRRKSGSGVNLGVWVTYSSPAGVDSATLSLSSIA